MWQCVKNCGACCHLDPEARPDLEEYLSETELAQYLSMVGEGGWCINFDRQTRQCKIYETRPRFCRVEVDTFKDMYGIEPEEMEEFAIACCEEQIADVYGEDSQEWHNFATAVGLD
jgi:Fe-S-cluster containining protein